MPDEWSKWLNKLQSFFFLFFFDIDVLCTCLRFQILMHSIFKWDDGNGGAFEIENQIANNIEILSKFYQTITCREAVKSIFGLVYFGHVKCFI